MGSTRLIWNGTTQTPSFLRSGGFLNSENGDGGRVDSWACVCFSTHVHSSVPSEFCRELIAMCSAKGMVFNPTPVIPIFPAQANQIDAVLRDIYHRCETRSPNKPLQLLIVILPDFRGSYEEIKRVCETELGIVSQCCEPRHAKNRSKPYLENVSLKINVKVGGQNVVLNDAVERRLPKVSELPTIIFGADVTHPPPGDDSSSSIAAVVASMDWPYVTNYRAIVSAQAHGEEIIQDLHRTHQEPGKGIVHSGMIREMFYAFRNATKQMPSRIVFYRNGVCEGQFSQVLFHEVLAIKEACNSLQDGYQPPITFVVVQKRHHTRLFPYDHTSRDQIDRSGNILPGTVVDTDICHPTEFDFYLNSHAGIQGTSRPTRYHVLYDENHFTADELQSLTNNLCFTYARCTRSVSIVPPAYYAHLAAARARYCGEGETFDAGSTSGSGPSIKENVKDVMFYC